MPTRSRAIAAALLATLIALLSATLQPAQAATISPEAELGFQQISQCLQSNSNLGVLLVVDESSSLQDTDPNDRRALLLANLVRSLGRQAGAATAEGSRRVDLAVSTFALGYTRVIPWTELNPSSTEAIASALQTGIPDLDFGGGTNHPDALDGARNQMAELSASGAFAQPPCQVTIVFTDGVLYVSDDQSVNNAAAQQMCAPGGVVDGVRRDGINLVTVMLFDEAVAARNSAEYQAGRNLLQAAAEGSAGGVSCGTVPIPAEYARGAYLEGSVDRLASLFSSAFALSQGGTLVPLAGSPATVQIDPGVSSFSVVGLAPQGLTITRPDGQQITIAKDSPGTEQALAVWDFDNVTVSVPVDDTGRGAWTITRPGQADEVSAFLFTGLGLKLSDVSLISGEKAEIQGTVVRPGSDTPVDLSVYSTASMTASVIGGAADPLVVDPGGTFSGALTPQSDSTSLDFDVTLNLTTESGQALQPISGRFSLPVTLPKEFPQVSPAQLALSPLIGRNGRAEGALTVTGSPDGPTNVCVDPVQWTAVDDGSLYTTEQEQGCFEVAANEQRQIPLAVTTTEPVDERVGGTLPLQVVSTGGTERDITVPVAFTASAPVNEGVRYGIVAALVALAVALPLLMLYLFNRRLARFQPAEGTRSAAVAATVTSSGVKAKESVVAGAGATTAQMGSFDIPAEKLRVMPAMDKPQRELPGPDGSSLQTRMPRNLIGTPSAVVVAGPGNRVFSNQAPYVHGDGSTAPVSMGLGDVWYATISDANLVSGDPAKGFPALLSAFVAPKGQGDSLSDVAARIRTFPHYESILSKLQVAAQEAAMKPAKDAPPATAPPVTPTVGPRPIGPGGGVGPTGPKGPGGPAGTGTPGGPGSPAGPKGPGGPQRPSGPGGPGARPAGPAATPAGPTGPSVNPGGPGGPAPAGPSAPTPGRGPAGPGGPPQPGGPGPGPGSGPGPSGPKTSGPAGPSGPGGGPSSPPKTNPGPSGPGGPRPQGPTT